MIPILKKDLDYVLPKLPAQERQNAEKVKAAIEGLLAERKGVYPLSEIEAALSELNRSQSR